MTLKPNTLLLSCKMAGSLATPMGTVGAGCLDPYSSTVGHNTSTQVEPVNPAACNSIGPITVKWALGTDLLINQEMFSLGYIHTHP